MADDEQPKKEGPVAVLVGVLVLIGLGALGVFLAMRTLRLAGGFWGVMALGGRMLLQLLLAIAAFLAYVACLALLHLVVSIALGTKLRRVRVFISFQHAYEPIATQLALGLGDRSIEVVKLPFRREPEHDQVVGDSLAAVRNADAVVVVPGPEPSWMANELGLAVGLEKPIAVIKHLPAQPLSDSLYRGHAVFAWDGLRTREFVPLRRFLAFATKSRADLGPQFLRVMAGFGKLVVKCFGGLAVFYVLVTEVAKVAAAFSTRGAEAIWARGLWLLFAVLAAGFAFCFGVVFLRRLRGIAVARQRIRTREATFAEFSEVFSSLPEDGSILEVLEKAPLMPRHEGTPTRAPPPDRT